MTILAIDTSTDYLSIALMRDGKIVVRFHRKLRMRHSSMLVPMINKLMKSSRIRLGAVDCFAISVGPGSFTGLRIGVTTVKGLSFALSKPIVAVPTLDVIAKNIRGYEGVVCPVLDARKNKVYACLYRSDGKKMKRISGYMLLPAKDLMEKTARYDKIMYLGNGVHLMERSFERSFSSHSQDQTLFRKDWYPRAEVVAMLGGELFKRKKITTAEKLEPLYLYSRECDIKGI